ncbi:Transcription factor spt8 [Quaeritorhiza haematococci]|nr:Transcription factor spt8 [Quaeritorhiza haematococci]
MNSPSVRKSKLTTDDTKNSSAPSNNNGDVDMPDAGSSSSTNDESGLLGGGGGGTAGYLTPSRSSKGKGRELAAALAAAQELATAPVVPFSIVAGHHGGVISRLLMDETKRYLVSTSGTRGWDGVSTNMCLFYDIAPLENPLQYSALQ